MVRVDNLTIRQGNFAVRDISFEVPAGRYAVLMGPTGAGKSSLLEVIAGLRRPDCGRVALNGRDVTRLRPADRGVGYVPQDRALFLTMTIGQNLAFPLALRRLAPEAIERRVAELAGLLSISHLLERSPGRLSGGEAQRVALGRALAASPSVLLLDEPLSALDDQTAADLARLLQRLRDERTVTVLHVTHNRAEAEHLADLRLRLEHGRIVTAPTVERPAPVVSPSPAAECTSCV